ncbi:MAG: PadR family transcriptional regulator [Erythrobacter sp.]
MSRHRYRRHGRGGGWEKFGPVLAMMAASGGNWDWDSEDEWEDDEHKARRRHRKRRARMFAQGELRLALLALINDEPRHGYELIKAIEELTGGKYSPSPGIVYPTLQMLADEGKIEEAKAKGAKKPFATTKDGSAELEERADEVEALMARLAEHGEQAEKARVRSPDLFRAMGNLASVLKNRARSGKLDKVAMNEIVDIIDEVAKRIERI